jgi:folate-binding protein YgfZ
MGRISAYELFLDSRAALASSGKVEPDLADLRAQEDLLLAGGVALSDRSQRDLLVVSGLDAIPFLQGLVTNDLYRLEASGSGQHTSVVDIHGRLVCDLRLVHLMDMLLVDAELGVLDSGVLAHLRRHVINEDVVFEDRTERASRISLWGEGATSLLESFDGLPSVRALPLWHAVAGEAGGIGVVVQRVQLWSGVAYDLLVDIGAAEAMWRLVEERHPDVFVLDESSAETFRILAGIPKWGVELDSSVIPLEAGLEHTISYDKGCYLGQEIIARIDTLGTPRRLLRTLAVEGDVVPRRGDAVEIDGRAVGDVRSACRKPSDGAVVALAYVKRGANETGNRVDVAVDGTRVRSEVCGLREDPSSS